MPKQQASIPVIQIEENMVMPTTEEKAEKSPEQIKEAPNSSEPMKGKELIAAAKELADKVKIDTDQRKQDYDSGKRRITSSYDILKDLTVSLMDGDKKLVGRPTGEVNTGFAKSNGSESNGSESNLSESNAARVGEGYYGVVGRAADPFDVEKFAAVPSDAQKESVTDADGYKVETITRKGETVKNEFDEDGKLVSRTYDIPGGGQVHVDFDGDGKPGLPSIEHTDGTTTTFRLDKDGNLVGEHRADDGVTVLEKASFMEGKIIYEDVKTHAKRAVSFEAPNSDHISFHVGDLGSYDANTGTLTKTFGEVDFVQSFARGRTDIVHDGNTFGLAINGEVSIQNESGEASIARPDGSGVYLHSDGTIDRWGPKPEDNVKGEALSPKEAAYIKAHKDIDLRDVAEIHERFKGDQAKLDKFYTSLEKLDSAKNLTDAERKAIRQDLMDHVANPESIYQGVTDSCNVSVIQRDLVMNSPEKYVDAVVTAVGQGKMKLADGTEVPLDVNNLKMADASGRDLATRIFQTAALHAEFHPTKNFVNTPDGVGALKPGKDDPRGTLPVPFDGLYPSEIAEVRYKLTGEEKAVTFIKTADDLKKALDENGGPPMTVLVDSSHAPFGDGDAAATAPNHVVTIVGIENGPPVKYLVQNQFGLEHDHSTKGTAVSADDLLANMSRHKEINPTTGIPELSTDRGAMVITKGDHKSAFTIIDGTKSERTDIATNLEQSNRSHSRVGTGSANSRNSASTG